MAVALISDRDNELGPRSTAVESLVVRPVVVLVQVETSCLEVFVSGERFGKSTAVVNRRSTGGVISRRSDVQKQRQRKDRLETTCVKVLSRVKRRKGARQP